MMYYKFTTHCNNSLQKKMLMRIVDKKNEALLTTTHLTAVVDQRQSCYVRIHIKWATGM